ncbi:MAG: gamma-glutamylcyclotransferase [Planctomycetota bacterium]|nr:gamma-glutamylcyclotransferase [Planctomycetota bacterium]
MHWVFAYGSNMHLLDLRRWLRAQGHADRGPLRVEVATIQGFELAWNYRSASRQGGAANTVPRAGAVLRGLALEVDGALLAALDAKEGHPTRYNRGEAPHRAELLRAEGHVAAWLYRVTPAYEMPHDVPPRRAYLDLILEAAEEHDLGADYVAALRSIPVAD